MAKIYNIEIDEDQLAQLGHLFDDALRCHGIKHCDVIQDIRLQVKKQLYEQLAAAPKEGPKEGQ